MKKTKYYSATCNLSFTGDTEEEAKKKLLSYLKGLVKKGDLSNWYINEE
tara:strand:- start:593 stop:739 length:147 start_codon:yes stop_codon:yes gene_type:complete